MKLEALQSLSVVVLVVGLCLSALGGFGAYFFSGGSERAGHAQAVAKSEPAKSGGSKGDAAGQSKLAAIVEPVSEVTARQLTLNPDPKLTPLPEKQPAPKPVATPVSEPAPDASETVILEKKTAPAVAAIQTPKPPELEPPAVIAKTVIPETRPPAETPGARHAELGIAPWQKEKLLQRLRTFQSGSIALQVPDGNEEAMGFATALKEAFLAAGWHVTGLTAVKTDRDSSGLTLSSGTFPPPPEVTTIFSALVSAGIKLNTELDPMQGKKHAILFIGSRP